MLRFNFAKPARSFTMHTDKSLVRFVVPVWYSKVELGDWSYMNDECDVLSLRESRKVVVGKYSSVGKCKFVMEADHNTAFASTYPFNELGCNGCAPLNKKDKQMPDILVGNDVWICDDAVIYGGVTIGDGAVVAGNAVVTKDVPSYAIVAGNPARVVKYRFNEHIIKKMIAVQWWDLPHYLVAADLAPLISDPDAFIEHAESLKLEMFEHGIDG